MQWTWPCSLITVGPLSQHAFTVQVLYETGYTYLDVRPALELEEVFCCKALPMHTNLCKASVNNHKAAMWMHAGRVCSALSGRALPERPACMTQCLLHAGGQGEGRREHPHDARQARVLARAEQEDRAEGGEPRLARAGVHATCRLAQSCLCEPHELAAPVWSAGRHWWPPAP